MAAFFLLLSSDFSFFHFKQNVCLQPAALVAAPKVRAALFHFLGNTDFMRVCFKGLALVPLEISLRGPLTQEIISMLSHMKQKVHKDSQNRNASLSQAFIHTAKYGLGM